ncbi:hypothetical protein F0562_000104 [Nyssa sinensis]|uniref:COI1 F-box domain-containing protein n=1 Tax=Nyssa sinensis TaxID=561372 RepID=A0A5J5C2Q7_9ASTE|nr:hypothetical protein F0562_000104 [Nyssa sinensis]
MDCLVNVLGTLEMESLFWDIPFVRKSCQCPQEALIYVANECPALKYLALPSDLMYHQGFTISSLICKWKKLEMLRLKDSYNLEATLTQVSLHCKNFVGLDFTPANIGEDGASVVAIGEHEASAIVTLLPNIKHLVLRCAFLKREFLVMILQGCKELVHLDVRDCIGFKADNGIWSLLLILGHSCTRVQESL